MIPFSFLGVFEVPRVPLLQTTHMKIVVQFRLSPNWTHEARVSRPADRKYHCGGSLAQLRLRTQPCIFKNGLHTQNFPSLLLMTWAPETRPLTLTIPKYSHIWLPSPRQTLAIWARLGSWDEELGFQSH